MDNRTYLLTSESVTEGHPDKIADQVSDAVLDAIMANDPTGRVACETMVTTGLAIVANALRTTSLFHIESGRIDAPDWFHPAIGLAVQALVVVVLVSLVPRPRRSPCALEPST